MSREPVDEHYVKRGGTGGRRERYQILTHGVVRVEVDALEPALHFPAATNTPDAPTGSDSKGVFFFRDDGAGKAQYCVRFPSGAVQILATEP